MNINIFHVDSSKLEIFQDWYEERLREYDVHSNFTRKVTLRRDDNQDHWFQDRSGLYATKPVQATNYSITFNQLIPKFFFDSIYTPLITLIC